jgi:thiol:disulfide interchange protein DsbC
MKKIVEKRPDIAFYLKLFALVSPDPQVVKSIICAKSMPMLEDAYEHKSVEKQDCSSTELETNAKLAEESGITSAPSLVFPDGTIQSGYSEAIALEKRIDESKGKADSLKKKAEELKKTVEQSKSNGQETKNKPAK